jgi:hypothetical protein
MTWIRAIPLSEANEKLQHASPSQKKNFPTLLADG